MYRLLRSRGCFSSAALKGTYYDILGVSSNATTEQIMSAYHKLCEEHHPSVAANKNVDLSLFQKINEAYIILSGTKSREAYDSLELHQTAYKKQSQEISDYHLQKEAKNAQYRKRHNIDKFGRYAGGLPGKKRGLMRGNSMEEVGVYHNSMPEDEAAAPDYAYVDAQRADSFKNFHQDQREFRTAKWTWIRAQVDYDYFSFNTFARPFRIFRNILLILLVPEILNLYKNWNVMKEGHHSHASHLFVPPALRPRQA